MKGRSRAAGPRARPVKTSFLSLRPLLHDRLADFARPYAGAAATVTSLLTEAVVGISDYREEGARLLPAIFFTDDLGALLSDVGGSDPIALGEAEADPHAVRVALKACGGLGEGRQWAVYLEVRDRRLRYGVFRTDGSPLRETSFEQLRRLRRPGSRSIGITRIGASLVEIRTAGGKHEHADFSGSAERSGNPRVALRRFIGALSRDAPAPLRRQLEAFYYRVTVELFSGAHGALAAVMGPSATRPAALSDGIWLRQPLDLGRAVEAYERAPAEGSALALVGYAGLVRRMLSMDGVTVFGSDGTVLGYNCFVEHPGSLRHVDGPVGGARRRAYQALCALVGTELLAALYQSQDGATECFQAPHPERRQG
jgi:hypothetical protein